MVVLAIAWSRELEARGKRVSRELGLNVVVGLGRSAKNGHSVRRLYICQPYGCRSTMTHQRFKQHLAKNQVAHVFRNFFFVGHGKRFSHKI
jgi:hypothetical protein